MIFNLARHLIAVSAIILCANLPSAAEANSVKLSYQYLNSPSSKPLATIDYDPSSLKSTLTSWTPPPLESPGPSSAEPVSSRLLRILLPSGSSTLTSLATFNSTLNQTLSLWLSPAHDGSIVSASLSASAPPTLAELKAKAREERRLKRNPKSKKALKPKEEEQVFKPGSNVKINLMPPTRGPSPVLVSRKAPAVGADGQEVPAEEEVEKSFFQKYWWIFLIGAIFAVGGGGGGS